MRYILTLAMMLATATQLQGQLEDHALKTFSRVAEIVGLVAAYTAGQAGSLWLIEQARQQVRGLCIARRAAHICVATGAVKGAPFSRLFAGLTALVGWGGLVLSTLNIYSVGEQKVSELLHS